MSNVIECFAHLLSLLLLRETVRMNRLEQGDKLIPTGAKTIWLTIACSVCCVGGSFRWLFYEIVCAWCCLLEEIACSKSSVTETQRKWTFGGWPNRTKDKVAQTRPKKLNKKWSRPNKTKGIRRFEKALGKFRGLNTYRLVGLLLRGRLLPFRCHLCTGKKSQASSVEENTHPSGFDANRRMARKASKQSHSEPA